MTKILCDKCGKDITGNANKIEIRFGCSMVQEIEFCNRCRTEFQDFIRPKREQEQG